MPSFQCPNCGNTGQIPDHITTAPKRVRCKACQHVFSPLLDTVAAGISNGAASFAEPEISIVVDDPAPEIVIDRSGVKAPEKEPWFYEFLAREAKGWEVLARFVVWFNIALFALVCIWAITLGGRENPAVALAACAGIGLVMAIEAFCVWRMLMLIAAWIHLSVDHARNDRRSRLILERQMG
jgi:hypothetical protein